MNLELNGEIPSNILEKYKGKIYRVIQVDDVSRLKQSITDYDLSCRGLPPVNHTLIRLLEPINVFMRKYRGEINLFGQLEFNDNSKDKIFISKNFRDIHDKTKIEKDLKFNDYNLGIPGDGNYYKRSLENAVLSIDHSRESDKQILTLESASRIFAFGYGEIPYISINNKSSQIIRRL